MNSNTSPFQSQPGQPRQTFFDSLRSSGYLRAEPRVMGGVLSGLSVKYGWDTTLLRIVTVVASLFFPLVAAAYAVAWFFLPEQRDGRIHAEALTLGYFNIAQLGALLLFLLGVGNSGLYFVSLGHFFWPVLLIGVGMFVYFLFESAKRTPQTTANTPPAPTAFGATPFAGSGAFPNATPANEASAASSPATPPPAGDWRTQGGPVPPSQPAAAFAPQQPTPQQPAFARPAYQNPAQPAAPSYYPPRPLQRPRTLPTSVNLLVTGLIALVFAVVSAFLFIPEFQLSYTEYGRLILAGGGLCLLLVAIPMGIAALRDRSAAWLVALSILGMTFAGPVSLGASAMIYDHHLDAYPNSIESQWDEDNPVQHQSTEHYIGTVGAGTWNLADLPDDDAGTYEVDDVLGRLVLYVRPGQPIEVNIDNAVGVINAKYLNEDSMPWVQENFGITTDLSMRSVADHHQPITTVNISSVLGTLEIVEVQDPRPVNEQPQSADLSQSATAADKPQSTPTPSAETAQSAQSR